MRNKGIGEGCMTTELTHKQFFNAPAVQEQFNNVLKGSGKQFTTSILSVIQTNGMLKKATNESIMTSAMKAAVLNLPIEPSLGFAYIVAYGNQAQFQLGYKGLIQLAIRSGQFKNINSGTVYKSQFKSYDPLFETLDADFTQPADEVHGYFATFELVNGFKKLTYWTKEQAETHGRRFSKSFNKGPWATDFDAMAKKTVLKDILSKYAPLSTEMQEAIVADNQNEDVSNPPKDVTPQTESLNDLLGVPEVTSEQEKLQGEEKTAEKKQKEKSSEYPADEIPDFDQETGEITDEQTALFDQLGDLV